MNNDGKDNSIVSPDPQGIVTKSSEFDDYPKEALPLGTYVRSLIYDKFGMIVDAFYDEEDEVGTKIIVYTILLSPEVNAYNRFIEDSEPYYLSNEYEYDIIAYLMIGPGKVPDLKRSLTGELYI